VDKLKSRKFWMAVIGGLLIVANDGLGLNLPKEAVMALAAVILSYIFGEAAVDAARALKR
jgi:uncharacterized membrane protein